MPTSKRIDQVLDLGTFKVPLRIYIEPRRSVRASLGKDWVILRVPAMVAHQIDQHIKFTRDWLHKILKKNPRILDKFVLDHVPSSYNLTILGAYEHTVKVTIEATDRGHARFKHDVLNLTIPEDAIAFEQRKMIRVLTSKILAKLYKNEVIERINYFNDTYFQAPLTGVSLKYNSTNWGSCSTSGRINISTRSLLLPAKSFDYLLVHELAHTKEMNHSAKFWKVVEKVMPDYKRHEQYIKQEGKGLDF